MASSNPDSSITLNTSWYALSTTSGVVQCQNGVCMVLHSLILPANIKSGIVLNKGDTASYSAAADTLYVKAVTDGSTVVFN